VINAAARDGLGDALRIELERTQPQLLARLEQYIPQMFPKAYRWVALPAGIPRWAFSRWR